MSRHRVLVPSVILAVGAALFACEPTERNGSGRAGVVEAPPDDEGCTLTQGYWKNHEESWPVDALTIGGVEYTKEELLALLGTPTRGDASLILGHQLIAAMLNTASGASSPADVADAFAQADAWMAANKDADGRLPYDVRRSAAADDAVALGGALGLFNEGGVGPGHCDGGPGSGSGSTSSGGTTTTGGGEDDTSSSASSSSSGGGTCVLTCGEGNVVSCPPDYDCVGGCCLPIAY